MDLSLAIQRLENVRQRLSDPDVSMNTLIEKVLDLAEVLEAILREREFDDKWYENALERMTPEGD